MGKRHSILEVGSIKLKQFIEELSDYYGVEPPDIRIRVFFNSPSYLLTEPRPEIRLRPQDDLVEVLHEFAHHIQWKKEHRRFPEEGATLEESMQLEVDAVEWFSKEWSKWIDRWKELG